MTKLRGQDGVTARALEFLILTAARASGVLRAPWSEINLAERVRVTSAERVNAGKAHRVPLSDAAMDILQKMADVRTGDFVFPGSRNATFASTLRDWAGETTAFPPDVCEAALAHAKASKFEWAYRRGDLFRKRRNLMDAWAGYCAAPATNGAVVPLRRPRGAQ
jgi:integrase